MWNALHLFRDESAGSCRDVRPFFCKSDAPKKSVDIDELAKLRVARTGTRVLYLFRSMTSLAVITKDDS